MSNTTNDSHNKKGKMGLGRGLGSLLGQALEPDGGSVSQKSGAITKAEIVNAKQLPDGPVTSVPGELRIWKISIDKLKPSSYQPRQKFDAIALKELSESIKQNGIVQPILARKVDGSHFEIIAGERRWRAAQLAGLHEVPVIIKNLAHQQTFEVALIENIQRENLNVIEEAEAYQRLSQEFNLTQQAISEKVGKDRATVANAMRLLQLGPQAKEALLANEITAGHAKLLVMLAPDVQTQVTKAIIDKKLSVRATEQLLNKQKAQESEPEKVSDTKAAGAAEASQRLVRALTDELQRKLATKVSIEYSQGKGKISVAFYSDEELERLVERLKAGRA